MNNPQTKNPNRQSVYLALLAVFLIGISTASAQYAGFAATNVGGKFLSIAPSGDSSAHVLKNVTIRANGTIAGKGIRYDLAANAVSPARTNGVSVVISTNSRIGLPVVVETNTTRWTNEVWNNVTSKPQTVVQTSRTITRSAPCGIFLSDGSRVKGVLTSYTQSYQNWNGSKLVWQTNGPSLSGLEAVIAYGNKLGSASLY